MTNQLRRATVSVVFDVAEGFGRQTVADRVHFYDMARASLHEVQARLLVAKDVGFISEKAYGPLDEAGTECHKQLTGLISALNHTKS